MAPIHYGKVRTSNGLKKQGMFCDDVTKNELTIDNKHLLIIPQNVGPNKFYTHYSIVSQWWAKPTKYAKLDLKKECCFMGGILVVEDRGLEVW
jgi:hypothetical protein